VQGNGAFGYGRRNTLFGPKLSDINLSLAKTWHYKDELGSHFAETFVKRPEPSELLTADQ